MTGAAFDAEAGIVRLPALAVEMLGRMAAGEDAEVLGRRAPDAMGLLERLGVVEGAELHPAVRELARAVAAPLVRMVVRVGRPAAAREARAWLDAGFAAYADRVAGNLYELVAGPPAAAPVFAAGLVGLGPRPLPRVQGEVVIADRAVRALLGDPADPEAVLTAAAVPAHWRAPLLALAASGRSTWSVQTRWMVAEGRVGRRSVGAVDGGDAGLWRYERRAVDGRDLAWMRPVRAREVWRELCALLPAEEELLTTP